MAPIRRSRWREGGKWVLDNASGGSLSLVVQFPDREPVILAGIEDAYYYRFIDNSNKTPSAFCSATSILEKFATEGLPFRPSIRIRLLAGMCVRSSKS